MADMLIDVPMSDEELARPPAMSREEYNQTTTKANAWFEQFLWDLRCRYGSVSDCGVVSE